jgi:ribA/ribD-fused uncharacterized protein
MGGDIYFWTLKGEFGCFSNFFATEFEENGRKYICSEQYFMKKKQEMFDPENADLGERIMRTKSAGKIKSLGREVHGFKEERWNKERYKIMLKANLLKFKANKEIKKILLATDNKRIFEASPSDRIWGIGYAVEDVPADESLFGLNLLGKVLMEVRDTLRNSPADSDS